MANKRLAILHQGNEYTAGVFTSNGLYAVNLPSPSIAEAISLVGASQIERCDIPQDLEVLERVFEIMRGENIEVENLKLDFSGLTEKQVRVLKVTLGIPHGQTRTYGEVASSAGLTNAARFVGNVMAQNRFPPIVPCHRVVASNGFGGYGAGDGIQTKIALLHAEGAIRGVISQNPLF